MRSINLYMVKPNCTLSHIYTRTFILKNGRRDFKLDFDIHGQLCMTAHKCFESEEQVLHWDLRFTDVMATKTWSLPCLPRQSATTLCYMYDPHHDATTCPVTGCAFTWAWNDPKCIWMAAFTIPQLVFETTPSAETMESQYARPCSDPPKSKVKAPRL